MSADFIHEHPQFPDLIRIVARERGIDPALVVRAAGLEPAQRFRAEGF